ncbi:MAG: NADH:flavin oxidoreductase/NADH oxidase [Rhodospirillales bacterium]|nr:NADH:flavin oxidoreductase/NADH oxidase [Rhodospirillales bacterium]
MASQLFTPITLRDVELPNRIIVAPMCQYSADGGSATDWHLMHLGQFAVSGVGLLFVEATGVEPEGRITPGCVGLYSDANEAALKRVVDFCKTYGNTKIGMQLAHAGRKASTDFPWVGGKPIPADDARGWHTESASATPYADGWQTPAAMDDQAMERIKQAFVQATERCVRIGFDVLELHMAHGYLFHQFLSPISNQRTDAYGGSLENRMRFPLEVFDAARAVWPKGLPLGVRFSATDWVAGSSWDVSESSEFATVLKAHGCDFVDVSSGGNSPAQEIAAGPGYQSGFAADIRRTSGIATMAVGQITSPQQAESIIRSGQADMVALARGMLYNPRWAWHAAEALNAEAAYAPQYMRTHSSLRGLPIPGNPPAPKT